MYIRHGSIFIEKGRKKKAKLKFQLADALHKYIINNNLQPGDKLPKFSEIASWFDINYRTVKQAVEILQEKGTVEIIPYKGAVVRASVEKTYNKTLRFCFIKNYPDPFCVELAEGINKFCEENKLEFVLSDSGADPEKHLQLIRDPGRDIDGLLLIPFDTPEFVNACNTAIYNGMKMVFLDRPLAGVGASCVSCDHFAGAYQATCHLLDKHGLPVYLFTTESELGSNRERKKGWQQAMWEFRYYTAEKYFVDLDSKPKKMYKSSKMFDSKELRKVYSNCIEFFKHLKQKASIFTINDYMAGVVYEAAAKIGLEIGKDIFIVGFGNLPLAKNPSVSLTSVEQNSRQVGYEAAKILYEHISGNITNPTRRMVKTELCIRNSSSNNKVS